MATHDYIISNASGAAVRADLNNALAAIATNNSSATEPTTTYAYQWWADTGSSPTVMKLRNAANSAWITLFQLDGEWSLIPFENGTAAAPSIYFKDSGTDTGFFSPGTDSVAITTGGTQRATVDSSGRLLAGVSSTTAVCRALLQGHSTSSTADTKLLLARGNNTPTADQTIGQINFSDSGHVETASISCVRDTGTWTSGSSQPSRLTFTTTADGSATPAERLRITAAGRVGIGTTNPGTTIETASANTSGDDNSGNIYVRTTDAQGTNIGGKITLGGFYNATQNYPFAGIAGRKENATSNNVAGYLQFLTTTSGGALSERARIDSSGRLLVGTSSANGNYTLQIQGDAAASTSMGSIYLRRGLNTASIGANVGAGLGQIVFGANDGTTAALIECTSDATWSSTSDTPGRLLFYTTADGAATPTERMRIRSDGNIGVFNTPGVYPNTDNAAGLGFSGFRWSSIYAANGTIQTSDQRAKTEVSNASLGSDFIKALRPVSYKWTEGGKRDTGERDEEGNYIYETVPGQRTHWGFIAQEVKEAVDAAGVDFGGWVLTDKDDPDSQQALRYDQFIAPLTKALQEALEKIETLEAKVAALESA